MNLNILARGLPSPCAVMAIRNATGEVWLPAQKVFGPANGTIELTPFRMVVGTGPNVVGVGIATLEGFPSPRAEGEYSATIHRVGGGEAIGVGMIPPTMLTTMSVSFIGG